MIFNLIISEQAQTQLESIIEYVAETLLNPSAARAILSDVEKAYEKLECMADSFTMCMDPYLAAKGYRKYILANHDYVIIYRVVDTEVLISGIYHMKEDYASRL